MQPARAVPIRSLDVLSISGRVSRIEKLMCPTAGVTVSLAECIACENYEGRSRSSAGGKSAVRCGAATFPPTIATPGYSEPPPVSAIMTSGVLYATIEMTIVEAASMLVTYEVGGLPVLDGKGSVVGVISGTDLLWACVHAAPDTRVDLIEIGQVMSPSVLALPPVAPITLAAATMAIHGVHRVVVTAEDTSPVGIVSALDIVRWMALEGAHERATGQRRSLASTVCVAEVLRSGLFSVRHDLSAEKTLETLLVRGLSAAPVLGIDGVPLGLVSRRDLLRHRLHEWANESVPAEQRKAQTRATARDLMGSLPEAVDERTSLSRVASIMALGRLHHALVRSRLEGVVGLLSALDLLAWLAEQDGYQLESRRG